MIKIKITLLLLMFSVIFISLCSCGKEKFTVTFDSNGGSKVPSQKIEKFEYAYEPKDPVKEGFNFGGWFLNLNDINPYNFSTEIIKNITLKAKWIDPNVNHFTISFDSDGGNDISSILLEEGKEIDLPTPKKNKYIFMGWYDGKTKIENTKNITCDLKLKAKWEIDPKEVVKATDISLNKTSITILAGNSEKISAIVEPSDATNNVTFKSSNTNVVKVSSNGTITGVSKGNAIVTASIDGKSATLKVDVLANEKADIENAKSTIKAKTLTEPTSLNYTSSNCTITSSTSSSGKTIVEGEKITKLYRSKNGGTLTSTYAIKCGSKEETVKINHKISPSPYTYTAINSPGSMYYIIQIKDATNYTLSSSKVTNLKYNSNWNGVQTDIVTHQSGTVYDMVLNNEPNTIYEVTGTTN